MFNKDKNKTKETDQITISVKMHTMKDDIDSFVNVNKNQEIPKKEAVEAPPIVEQKNETQIENNDVVEAPIIEEEIVQEPDVIEAVIPEEEIVEDVVENIAQGEEIVDVIDDIVEKEDVIEDFADNSAQDEYIEQAPAEEVKEVEEEVVEDIPEEKEEDLIAQYDEIDNDAQDKTEEEVSSQEFNELENDIEDKIEEEAVDQNKRDYFVDREPIQESGDEDDLLEDTFENVPQKNVIREEIAPAVAPVVVDIPKNDTFNKVENEDVFRIIRNRENKSKSLGSDSPFLTNKNRSVDDITPKQKEEVEIETPKKTETHNFFPKIETEIKNDVPSIKKNKNKNNSNISSETENLYEYEDGGNGTWFYMVILVLFLVLGGLGYYVFMIKEKDLSWESVKELLSGGTSGGGNVLVDSNGDAQITGGEIKKSNYSDKINFLVVDESQLNKSGIKNLINETFVKMNGYSGDQLEFLLVDKNNTPIKFEKFASSMGIVLGKNVLNNMHDNFSIFLSKKDGLNRMGLAINIQNKDVVADAIKYDEVNMLKNMEPIILGGEISSESKKTFASGVYKDINIRFMSLSSKPDLSIDYAIVKNYLIFATSKESGRLIIDKVLTEKGL